MSFNTIIIALIWGTFAGFLILRTLESLLAIIACLHGLLMTRWKRLTSKAAPGQVKYSLILRVLLQVALFGLSWGYLLLLGDRFVRREFWFDYQGHGGALCGILAALGAVILLRGAWRRLVLVWKITHEFDYAEKRQRTFLLKV